MNAQCHCPGCRDVRALADSLNRVMADQHHVMVKSSGDPGVYYAKSSHDDFDDALAEAAKHDDAFVQHADGTRHEVTAGKRQFGGPGSGPHGGGHTADHPHDANASAPTPSTPPKVTQSKPPLRTSVLGTARAAISTLVQHGIHALVYDETAAAETPVTTSTDHPPNPNKVKAQKGVAPAPIKSIGVIHAGSAPAAAPAGGGK